MWLSPSSSSRSERVAGGERVATADHRAGTPLSERGAIEGWDGARHPRPHGRPSLDRFDLLVLVLLFGVSLWIVGLDVWQAAAHGLVWTGTDGQYLVDQSQYLAWIRDASHHLLVSNLFVLRATPHDFLMPTLAVSGELTALGVSPWLALLLWKPVAVLALFFSVRAFVDRLVVGAWSRRSALILALFFASFSYIYGSVGVLADLVPALQTWGYPFAVVALAAMVGALLAYDRARAGDGHLGLPALLGCLASWLHPWQGELLIAILLGSELLSWGATGRPRPALIGITVVGSALPLIYYAMLARNDESWRLARNAGSHMFSLSAIAIAIAPLALLALPTALRRPCSFLDASLRVWLLAAFGLYELSRSGVGLAPLHAVQGITIPLALLTVQTLKRSRGVHAHLSRTGAALALAALTVLATVYALNFVRAEAGPKAGNANFIRPEEHLALDYLSSLSHPGGVLTRPYLGAILPGVTGRQTYVGTCVWSTPECAQRAGQTEQLFNAVLTPSAARQFVDNTDALYVLSDCERTNNLTRTLGPLVASIHHFGCATIYSIRAHLKR